MKILHYVDENRLSWSAPWRQLLQEIEQQGKKIENVIVCRPGGTLQEQIEPIGFRVFTYKPRFPWFPPLCRGFARILLELKPDIIHTRLSSAALIAGYWGKKTGIPVISTVDKYPKGKYYKNSSVVVPSSRDVSRHMAQEGFGGDSLKVVTNSIRVEDYQSDPVERGRFRQAEGVYDDRPIILGMGRFVRWKGFDLLIEAVSSLETDSPYELWLVGDGVMKEDLKNLAEKLLGNKQGARVKFFPFAEDVKPFLRAADIFIQPSYHVPGSGGPETFSLALLEAMASGLPVVAFNCGGAPDVVEEDVTGWLAYPGNASALALAIEKGMSCSSEQKMKIGVQAQKKVQEHDSALCAKNYIGVYKSMLQSISRFVGDMK